MSNIHVPAGTYYIGDLCYVLESCWGDVCEKMLDGDLSEGSLIFNGVSMVFFFTAHGDGTYFDNFGREYMVDSGLIGLIRIDELKSLVDDVNEDRMKSMGAVVEINKPFSCYKEGAVLHFGEIQIDTDFEDYDEEFDEEDQGY